MPEISVAERAGVGLDGAPRASEDRVAVLDDAVVLLDGATETRQSPPAVTVGAYVDGLLAALSHELTTHPSTGLTGLLAAAIRAVTARLDLTPGAAPSATVAIVRWTPNTVDALVLADSPVVLFTGAGHRVVADERLARLAAAGALRTEADVAALRNRDQGFWVAEAESAAASRAVLASVPRADARAALLASDGVSCGVDRYRLLDWPEVLATSTADGPDSVLDTVRAAERSDAGCTRWPRSKVHDDQALAVVRF